MEAFESFIALALEAEDFVVAGPLKFKVTNKTKKTAYDEFQTHGYEVDLVAARADKLVLASVKGFFGSQGVKPNEVAGELGAKGSAGYKMLNDKKLREQIVNQAAEKFGYKPSQVEMRLYGGKFKGGEKGLAEVRAWASRQQVGSGPIGVYSVTDVSAVVLKMAESKTYRDHEVLMTIKVLLAADLIKPVIAKVRELAISITSDGLENVAARLPIGATVVSNKDGLTGVVLGHKQDDGKSVYVRIWVDGAEKSHLRAASTLRLVEQRR